MKEIDDLYAQSAKIRKTKQPRSKEPVNGIDIMLKYSTFLATGVVLAAALPTGNTANAQDGVSYHQVWDTCRSDDVCNEKCNDYVSASSLEYTRGGADSLPPNHKYHAWRACALYVFDECARAKKAVGQPEQACMSDFAKAGGDGQRRPGD